MSEIYESVYIIMEKFGDEVVIKLNNPDVRPFSVESELLLKCNVIPHNSFIDFQDVFEKIMGIILL